MTYEEWLAHKSTEFDESKVRRDSRGRFAEKSGAQTELLIGRKSFVGPRNQSAVERERSFVGPKRGTTLDSEMAKQGYRKSQSMDMTEWMLKNRSLVDKAKDKISDLCYSIKHLPSSISRGAAWLKEHGLRSETSHQTVFESESRTERKVITGKK
jgi:hypothetical protein